MGRTPGAAFTSGTLGTRCPTRTSSAAILRATIGNCGPKRRLSENSESSPEISWISTSMKDDMSLTIFGNSITLTPGTVTVAIRKEGMIQVHALTREGMRGVRNGVMAGKVSALTYKEGGK